MLKKTLREDRTRRGFVRWRTIVRNAVVLSCFLVAMQLVMMNSAEVIDSKSDVKYLKYKTAAFSHIKFPRLRFLATAYCQGEITKSGLPVVSGLIAADPTILPIGSLVQIDSTAYRGLYQVMDTGRLIKGRRIDIYIPNTRAALAFGAQRVSLRVLRYGFLWNEARRAAASALYPTFSIP